MIKKVRVTDLKEFKRLVSNVVAAGTLPELNLSNIKFHIQDCSTFQIDEIFSKNGCGRISNSLGKYKLINLSGWDFSDIQPPQSEERGVSIAGKLLDLKEVKEFPLKIDVSNWKFGKNVWALRSIFEGFDNSNIILVGLSTWDVSGISDMTRLFADFRATISDNIGNWNVSNLERGSQMFKGVTSSNLLEGLDRWNLRSLKYSDEMFMRCSDFCIDTSNWNIEGIKVANNMFNWATINQGSNLSGIKFNTKHCDAVSIFHRAIINSAKGIDSWNVKGIVSMSEMFSFAIITDPSFNINNWDVSGSESMKSMFKGVRPVDGIVIDLSNWNTRNVESMIETFASIEKLGTSIIGLDKLSTSNVVSLSSVFEKSIFNGPINLEKWKVSKVISMDSIFHCTITNGYLSGIEKWKTGNLRSLDYAFSSSDIDCDVSEWKTSKVTSIRGILSNSENYIDISNWNVSKVRDADYAFFNYRHNVDISKWKTSSLVTASYFMAGASELDPDLSGWKDDVSNLRHMYCMFSKKFTHYSSLEDWKLSANLDLESRIEAFYGKHRASNLPWWARKSQKVILARL